MRAPALVLGGAAVAAGAVHLWFASRIPTPWIFIDELLHAELAESVAAGDGWRARGEPKAVSYVYPALVAPAWWAPSIATSYVVVKMVNIVLMSLTSLGVFLWGRRFLSPRGAVAAGVLVLVLPAWALAGTVSTENAFLPAFVLACLAAAWALERPTPARQALVLGAVAVAVLTRFQGLVLVPAVAMAVIAFDRRCARAWWPSALVVTAGGLAYLLARVAAQGLDLGVYGQAREADYSLDVLARWALWTPGVLALSVAVLPLAALVAVAVTRARSERERAFVAVAVAATVWLVVLATVASAWLPVGVKERYMAHCAPLLVLALVLWVERGMPRGRPVVAGCAAVAAAVAVVPIGDVLRSASLQSNALGLFGVLRVSDRIGSVGATRVLLLVAAVVGLAAMLLAPRRLVARAAPAAVAVALAAGCVAAWTTTRAYAAAVEDRAGGAGSWIDDEVGGDAEVAILNTTNFDPEALVGETFVTWDALWTHAFWNRSVRRSLSLGLPEPAPLAQERASLDFATGRMSLPPRVRYVLVDRRWRVVGRELARRGDFALWELREPRFASATLGVFRDGWIGGRASYLRWSGPPGTLRVDVLEGAIDSADGGRPRGPLFAPLDVVTGALRPLRVEVPGQVDVIARATRRALDEHGRFRDLGARVRLRFEEEG